MVPGFRRGIAACLLPAAAILALCSSTAVAHEVPNDVTIQTYIKPDGQRLLMLVRVPLIAMRDMTWPFRSPDVLDLARVPFELHNAATLWIGDEATLYEGDRALPSPEVAAVRATPAGNTSFESFDRAVAWLTGPPVPEETEVTIKDGFLDILFAYPVQSATSRFSIAPRWGRLGQRALTVVHAVLPDGTLRTIQVESDPGLIHLDPTWLQTVARFARQGFLHARDAVDPLLFVLCLVMPFRRMRDIVMIVAAFILAHSMTLAGASYFSMTPDALWFAPAVSALIAVSIVYVAIENLLGTTPERRRTTAFVLGLVHGFAFAFVLNPARQFAGTHPLASVLSFNAGVEAGLLIWLALLVVGLSLLFRFVVAENVGLVVLSAVVGHTGWHWMTERGSQALQYQIAWPAMTAESVAALLRWLMFAVATGGVLWLMSVVAKSWDLKSQRTGSR